MRNFDFVRIMKRNNGLVKRFSTVWAIEDPVDELFQLIHSITSYRKRYKYIVMGCLFLALLFFSYVIFSVVSMIIFIGSTFLLSQSQGTFLLIDNLLELSVPLFSLPFTTVVILFLVQNWKYFEVLQNRILTIQEIWNERQQGSSNGADQQWNPMKISMLLFDEMDQQSSQLKKQLVLTSISFVLSGCIIFFLSLYLIFFIGFSFNPLGLGYTGMIPLFLLIGMLLFIPWLVECYRFFSWSHQTFEIIKSVYESQPPLITSSSEDGIIRLSTYLENRYGADKKNNILLVSPFTVDDVAFDAGVKEKNQLIFVRKSTRSVPTSQEIDAFVHDVKKVLSNRRMKTVNVRAIFLCDWREEEGDISEEVERKIRHTPIVLGRGVGGGRDCTYVQLLIDYQTMYTMFPLVPEQQLD